jgi:hypothetical protein
MPRNSPRKVLLDCIDEFIHSAFKECLRLQLYGLPTSTDRAEELLFCCWLLQKRVRNKRYLARLPYRRQTGKFHKYIDTTDDDCLSDKEFRFYFRMFRSNFWELVNLLKDHPAFKPKNSDSRGPLSKPASHQLLLLLKYYGSEGNQGPA